MSDYFADLAARLRDRGVPADRVAATLDDLRLYADESGADPEEEFGPAADFAARLGDGDGNDAGDAPAAGEWVWTADAFTDEQRLNEFGAQGWEVERIDTLGRFVSRRDPDSPQRWEYRRRIVTPRGRAALVATMAPDGWEPCGSWFHFEYFKRPEAASVGPAAEIGSPSPVPPAKVYFGRRFYLAMVALAALLVLPLVLLPDGGLDTVAGGLVGAAIGVGAVVLAGWFSRRRQER